MILCIAHAPLAIVHNWRTMTDAVDPRLWNWQIRSTQFLRDLRSVGKKEPGTSSLLRLGEGCSKQDRKRKKWLSKETMNFLVRGRSKLTSWQVEEHPVHMLPTRHFSLNSVLEVCSDIILVVDPGHYSACYHM